MLLRIRPAAAAAPSLRRISSTYSARSSFSISSSSSPYALFPPTNIFTAHSLHSTTNLSAIHKRYCTTESTTAQIAPDTPQESEIIFVGTGTSEGIPRVSCLTNPYKKCEVCSKAANPGDKNKRLNTSILIRYSQPAGNLNILIDAGKFFYHSALRWFPTIGIRKLDAVLITHSHADAIGGLDDLRDWTNNVQRNIPIYVANRDFEVMKKTHYYLVDTSVVTPGAAVSDLQFKIINEEPFVVYDIKFTPLPVWHGKDYRSLGFRFGNICYISDVSEIPEETYPLLKDCDLLIMDALRPDRSSATHFGLPRALEEVRKIQPKRTLFTGMMHLMDHEKINEQLIKLKDSEGLDVQLSYDGLRVPVTL
ncbi:putative hydrolase C777.06c isoform X1 [Daucus carota subsp. sativus]|uniref:putative hydrolase C777.06c isoform X1 n=1 Tax=Daucus carota subsp. sativus TaxID=79200 RepID=UPI0007EFB52D|nr:PREDICTED: putative hydrolase C777.06c isoform X1 [Daucus carota subsp. sativus]